MDSLTVFTFFYVTLKTMNFYQVKEYMKRFRYGLTYYDDGERNIRLNKPEELFNPEGYYTSVVHVMVDDYMSGVVDYMTLSVTFNENVTDHRNVVYFRHVRYQGPDVELVFSIGNYCHQTDWLNGFVTEWKRRVSQNKFRRNLILRKLMTKFVKSSIERMYRPGNSMYLLSQERFNQMKMIGNKRKFEDISE